MSLGSTYGLGSKPKFEPDDKVSYSDLGVGIEIEAEGYRRDAQRKYVSTRQTYWESKGDGSLREAGVEFTSRILFGKEIRDALEIIFPVLEMCNVGWRCAIHCHVDVRDLDWPHIKGICELYATLEPLVFAWEGNHREESRFCLPWYSCMDTVLVAANCVKLGINPKDSSTAEKIRSRLNNFGKYSALNLTPITVQGSIEFRHMESVKSIERILTYINMCMTIVRRGTELHDQSIISLLSGHGPYEFLVSILGGVLGELTEVQDYEGLLWKGVDTGNALELLLSKQMEMKERNLDDFPIVV